MVVPTARRNILLHNEIGNMGISLSWITAVIHDGLLRFHQMNHECGIACGWAATLLWCPKLLLNWGFGLTLLTRSF